MARTKRIIGSNTLNKRSKELFSEYRRKQAALDDERTESFNRAMSGRSYYDEPEDPNEEYFDEKQSELDDMYNKANGMARRASGSDIRARRVYRESMRKQIGLING